MVLLRTLLIAFLIGLPCVGQAVIVDHLNQATLSVKDRTTDTLNVAFKSAFAQVLIKMSGNPEVMTLPSIQNAMPDLQQWIRSYNYVSPQQDDETDDTSSQSLQLQVQFDRQGIAQLLQMSGQAIWSADRPLTLIYVDSNMDDWQPLIKQAASDYGVPVIFAVMDLTDQDVLQSPDAANQLARRYGVTSVLMLHVAPSDAQHPVLEGQYIINGNQSRWTVSGDANMQVAQNVVGHLMNSMMQQLNSADSSAMQSKITLNVMGVHDIADYAKVMRYLQQCEDVTEVSVKDVNGSGVLLSVSITGDLPRFQKILASDGRLKSVDSALAQNVSGADLYYYWS